MGEVPFREVYIHGLVRDEAGQKMSKSKGNIVDPLRLVDDYGADALRFAILASLAQGRDIKLGDGKVQGYRNFVTKLWNAARFCEMQDCRPDPAFRPEAVETTLNRWIVADLAATRDAVTQALEHYRFNEAALGLYRFVWDRFCDWYLELAKPVLEAGGAAAEETRATAAWVLGRLFRLLHPMMPFVTEALDEQLLGGEPHGLIAADWPSPHGIDDAGARAEIEWLIALVSEIRTARAELRVPAAAKLGLWVAEPDAGANERLAAWRPALERLARLDGIHTGLPDDAGGTLQVVVDGLTYVLPLAGHVDLAEERARLGKEMAKLRTDLDKLDKKLANPQFVAKAPEEVVEEQRERRAAQAATLTRLEAAAARLEGA
jgi:valyl-tRNA synthetase